MVYIVQLSSVTQSCLTLCDPMDCSTPGLPTHHQLPEFTQTHVHRVSDAIQPSHPLSSPSLLPSIFPRSGSFQMSQLFASGGQSTGVQCHCFLWMKAECLRIDAFELWRWRRLLRVPWTARRSNQSILKEISPGISLEGMMLKLKLQYFGLLM